MACGIALASADRFSLVGVWFYKAVIFGKKSRKMNYVLIILSLNKKPIHT